jgi:DNA-binding NarL/FixJ family response regulator
MTIPTFPLRTLVVDDSPSFRSALCAIVDRPPRLTVVGSAGDGPDAIRACQRLRPDLVLMDVRMPGMAGGEVAVLIRELLPRAVIILLSVEPDALAGNVGAIRACDRFLPKSALHRELWPALESLFPALAAEGTSVGGVRP